MKPFFIRWWRPHRRHLISGVKKGLIFVLAATCVACTDENNPESPQNGDWNLTLSVSFFDEFNRRETAQVEADVVLVAKDRTLHANIPAGRTSCTFNNLPLQTYVANVEASGYYPASARFSSFDYGFLTGSVGLYRLPSSMMRIDSVACTIATVVPQVHVVFYTAQDLPLDGSRSVILFAGLRKDVGPRFGNHVFAVDYLNQVPGASVIQTDDLFRSLRAAGFASGMRVYVTGRIRSPATFVSLDTATHLYQYFNLEENTRAYASFIMP